MDRSIDLLTVDIVSLELRNVVFTSYSGINIRWIDRSIDLLTVDVESLALRNVVFTSYSGIYIR